MTQTVANPQPGQIVLDDDKIQLIKSICARDCTDSEFQLLIHLANTYGLDPLARQIWAVKYPGSPAQIFAGRDGFLAIAHRTGVFDGLESGVEKRDGEWVGWARVYRKDMSHSFYIEAYEKEYNTGKSVWKTKPRTMIKKVAESQTLRQAFSISGLYSPEEFDYGPPVQQQPDKVPVNSPPAPKDYDPSVCSICRLPTPKDEEKRQIILDSTGGVPMCQNCFREWWAEKQQNEKSETEKELTATVKAPPEEKKSKPEAPKVEEPKVPETAPETPEKKPAPKVEEPKTGFCRCGCDAMPPELRSKFSASFYDIFQIRIPQDICEKCARAWWADLMEEKKKKGMRCVNGSA